MNIAVTGATGFVGRAVIKELIARGIRPILLARNVSSIPNEFQACPVKHLDLADGAEKSFELIGRPDVLIHLAWGGLPNYKSNRHFEIELPAQYRFLKELVSSGLTKIVIAGTCAEYGMQDGCLSESRSPRPNTAYSFAKDCLRQQLELLQQTVPFELVWARLFYMFGQAQNPSALYSQLLKAVQEGKKSFPMSGGEQLRDYQPVEKSAEALSKLALDPAAHGIYNVCSGKPVSVRGLVETWIRRAGWQITPEFGRYPYPDYESMAFWGDATKINNVIH